MPTLNAIIVEAARRCGLVFTGTCSEAGTTSTLVDVVATEHGVDTKFGEGAWSYRPDAAAAADKLRRIGQDGFTVATGAWAPSRNWANAPANAEAYQMYASMPPVEQAGIPESWRRMVNRGLSSIYFEDEIVVARGDGSTNRRFPLERAEVTLFAFIVVIGGTGVVVTPPTGWTLIREDDSGANLKVISYRKRGLKTDGLTFDFTLDSSQKAAGVIIAVADANVTSPVDASAATTTASSTTGSSPAITTALDDELVLRFFGAQDVAAFTPPADQVEEIDVLASDGAAGLGAMLMHGRAVTAGDTGAKTATLTTARLNIAQTVAVARRDSTHPTTVVAARQGNNGSGATTLELPRPSALPNDDWVPNRQSARGAVLRSHNAGRPTDIDLAHQGRWFDVLEDGPRRTLEISTAPTTEQDVVLMVHRPYPVLSADDDATDCQLDLAALAARWKFYEYLNAAPQSQGQYKGELAFAKDDFEREYRQHVPGVRVVGG